MGIIYGFSTLLIYISYLLMKKTDKKIDILKQIVYGIVLLFCYNAVICYVLTLLTIPITLLGLSIINVAFAIIMIAYMIKKKKIQKYKMEKLDIIYILLLGFIVLFVCILNFGFPFQIKYSTGDPSAHYITSEKFAEEDSLLAGSKVNDAVYGKFTSRRFVSYVNSGLIMKCLDGVIDPLYNYEIFIGFGILTLFLTGWMFYSTVVRFAKNNILRFILFIISVFFVLGYPLNSLLYGFEYLSIAILILCAIIDSVNTYQNEEIGFKQNLLVFFLLNFGLFNSYYMFVPYTYSALWIYFCIVEYKRQKKLFTFKTATMLFVTLIIPFVLGYIYCIAPTIYETIISIITKLKNGKTVNDSILDSLTTAKEFIKDSEGRLTGLKGYGNSYVNMFSNMVLLLPFSIYAIVKGLKENKGVVLMTVLNFIFLEILWLGNIQGKVSCYYISKNYYPFWLFLFYLTSVGIVLSYEKHACIPILSVIAYGVIILLNLLFGKTNISFGELDPTENILRATDVFNYNRDIIMNSEVDLTREEINIIKYARDNIPEDKTVEVVGDAEQAFWEYAILRRINKDLKFSGQRLLEEKIINVYLEAEKVNYLIYFNRGQFFKDYKNKLITNNSEIVFMNDSGGILRYVNVE